MVQIKKTNSFAMKLTLYHDLNMLWLMNKRFSLLILRFTCNSVFFAQIKQNRNLITSEIFSKFISEHHNLSHYEN